jgi:LysR family transcriptional regulator, glycine cleavage system transcriptional activator
MHAQNACIVARMQASPPRPRRRRPIALAALRGFDAAARHLSFTLAAAELSLTQSSISRQIAALERQIGRPLFERRTRALELTAAGERLFAVARQALLAIDRTVDEIRGDGGTPRVTVTTYASFASLWLVPRLPDFQRAHAGIDIRIDASDRMVDLETDDVDLAIRWLRPGAPVPTDATLLQTEESTPALSPRLLAARGAPLRDPLELATLPILAMDETVPSAPYSSWARWCEYAGIAPFDGAARLYFTYVDQSVQAAVRGQGVALVRTPFVDDLVASGDLVTPFPRLRMPTGYRYFLIVNRKRAAVPHVAAFVDWVIDEFRRGPHRLT